VSVSGRRQAIRGRHPRLSRKRPKLVVAAVALAAVVVIAAFVFFEFRPVTLATPVSICQVGEGCAQPFPGPPPGEVLLMGGAGSVGPNASGADLELSEPISGAPLSTGLWNLTIMWVRPNGTQSSTIAVDAVTVRGEADTNLTGVIPAPPFVLPFGKWVTLELELEFPDEPNATLFFTATVVTT